jgi:hypothetical protein
MKTDRETPPRSFRLWEENRSRLDYAAKIGLNASEIVNELLSKHLRGHLEAARKAQAERLKTALAEPIP